MNEIYCAGIPDFVNKRLQLEITALENSETVMQFEAYRKISEIARQNAMSIIGVNGTFIAYLIGYMGVNPLPAHQYCTNCGKWECNNDYNKFEIDLPPKTCSCGHTMISM